MHFPSTHFRNTPLDLEPFLHVEEIAKNEGTLQKRAEDIARLALLQDACSTQPSLPLKCQPPKRSAPPRPDKLVKAGPTKKAPPRPVNKSAVPSQKNIKKVHFDESLNQVYCYDSDEESQIKVAPESFTDYAMKKILLKNLHEPNPNRPSTPLRVQPCAPLRELPSVPPTLIFQEAAPLPSLTPLPRLALCDQLSKAKDLPSLPKRPPPRILPRLASHAQSQPPKFCASILSLSGKKREHALLALILSKSEEEAKKSLKNCQ